MYKIICNMKASRTLDISEKQLQTIEKYSLFNELLDSNGIVDESVLEKLRLNVRSLLESNSSDSDLLYIDWEKAQLDALKSTLKEGIAEE